MISEAWAGAAQMAQQTINDQGTFGDYVRQVRDSRELVQLLVLLGAGTVGMLANYTYKWLRDEIRGSLWHYLVEAHPRRTMLSFVVFGGYALTTVISPVLDGAGWGVVINMGLTTGFAIDALVNKADRHVWTNEERTVRGPAP